MTKIPEYLASIIKNLDMSFVAMDSSIKLGMSEMGNIRIYTSIYLTREIFSRSCLPFWMKSSCQQRVHGNTGTHRDVDECMPNLLVQIKSVAIFITTLDHRQENDEKIRVVYNRELAPEGLATSFNYMTI